MSRRNILTLAGMMIVAAGMAVSAGARHDSRSAVGWKIYKSWQCNMPVKPYSFGTWACTTITVPEQVNAGETATVTFQFKAKTTLKYIDVCFGKINATTCAYRHKYVTINRGSTVKRVLQMGVPMVASSGVFPMDNYTRFYKLPKYGDRSAYWSARSFVCIVVSGDEGFKCPGKR